LPARRPRLSLICVYSPRKKDYWGNFMKARYFFRPIWRMFDFKGTTGRAEYFTYAVTSFLMTVFLTLATFIFFALNWPNILPADMLDENGRPPWLPPFGTQEVFNVLWSVFQFPMLALTVRRLRDQYASYWALAWLIFPLVGPAVLFGYGFVPTFRDHEVTLPNGARMMRSQQLSERRFRNTLISGAVVVGGTAALANAMSQSVGGLRLEGGKPVGVNRNASAFKADGSVNNRTSIVGERKAHMRGGKPVKASRNKYTL
jgi:uncharacterized membrane protein YhaH (DUF805 family)